MTTVHESRPLYAAIISQLETATGKLIGAAVSPGGAEPYAVVYPQSDFAGDGPLNDPNEMALQLFQVTAVGGDMDEAQWMQYEVRLALLGWSPTVTGWTFGPIRLDLPSGVLRDDDGPVFYTTDRFFVFVSPS